MKLSRSQKTVHKPKHHLKHLYCNKFLEGFIKPLPRYGKAINAIVLVAFVMLVVAGAGAITVHNKPPSITTSQTSSTGDNNCLSSNSGCPDSVSSSTPTTTPSTPATTTSPQSSNNSTTSGCTTKWLPPPPTTYKNTNLLPQGQTQQVAGADGDEYICNGKPTNVQQGVAPIVWVGTGTSSSSSTSQGSTPTNSAPTNGGGLTESQAAQQCDENLANGADASDPQGYLISCMHKYGY